MSINYNYSIEQGTPEWLEARSGLVTASTVGKLVTPTGKIANNDTVRQMAFQLASERITGRTEPTPTSYHMERGHIEEVFARELYQDNYEPVSTCGFITSDEMGFTVGYSPDGLVGDDGLIEIKSRMAKFQVQTICSGEVPKEYMLQLQFGLMVTGRKWIDFVQYSNGMPLFVERVGPDQIMFETMQEAVSLFEDRVALIIEEFKAKADGLVVAEYVQHIDGSEIEVGE